MRSKRLLAWLLNVCSLRAVLIMVCAVGGHQNSGAARRACAAEGIPSAELGRLASPPAPHKGIHVQAQLRAHVFAAIDEEEVKNSGKGARHKQALRPTSPSMAPMQ